MTREEAYDYAMRACESTWNNKVCADIRKALEQEPCEDCISRQAVLDMQYRIDDSETLSTRDVVNVDDIEDLPPVKPQPKTGHWIETDSDDSCWYMCSECHRRTDDKSDYCPNCGRRMVEPQESESKRYYMELAKLYFQGLQAGLAESEDKE